MVKLKVRINDNVVYPAKFGQKTTLSFMKELVAMWQVVVIVTTREIQTKEGDTNE